MRRLSPKKENVGSSPTWGQCLFTGASVAWIRQVPCRTNWVRSSVVRAADRRSAGPWFKSGCALGTERPALDERIVVKPTRHGENIVWRAPATRSSLAILNLRHCFPPALGLAYATACKLCTYTLQDIRWTLHVDLTGETL